MHTVQPRQVATLYSGPIIQVAALIRQVPLYTLCSPIQHSLETKDYSTVSSLHIRIG